MTTIGTTIGTRIADSGSPFSDKQWVVPCLMAAAMGLFAGCGERARPASVTSVPLWVMGTEATVVLPAREAHRLPDAEQRLATVLTDAEGHLSRFRDDSDIAAINRDAGRQPVTVAPLTLATLAKALDMARLSDGAFDPTIAPLIRLWSFGNQPPDRLPDSQRIQAARQAVDHTAVVLNQAAGTVFLQREGMSLDLGGIAKGTAVDAAATALTAAGYTDFLVNLGGDIRCRGAPDGQPAWRLGVRHPFDRDRILGVVRMVRHQAVVTSGNYERYVTIGDKRYPHVIDPRTGYPVHGMAGVTVLAGETGLADGLATALFVAGLDGATNILNRLTQVEVLMVPDRQPLELWVTPGFAAVFDPLPEFAGALRALPGPPAGW